MARDFLINSAKAVVVISHDRTFVDNITNRTIEVTMGSMIIKPNILII
jgi:ATP-binding cassette subfamily F protein 3